MPAAHDELLIHAATQSILASAATVSVGTDVAHRALPSAALCVTAFSRLRGVHDVDAWSASDRRVQTPANRFR